MLKVRWSDMLNTLHKIKPCDVLLTCNDGDRSYRYANKRYSPLIDSFSEYCQLEGLSTSNLSDDVTRYPGEESYNSPYVANRSLFLIKAFAKVARIIGLGTNKSIEMRLNLEVAMWRKVLLKAKPRLVVGIQPVTPLCIACSDEKIPIYDLQHGIITGDEDNRYYSLSRLTQCKENHLPQGFLVWDTNTERNIRSIVPLKDRDVVVIGNPWYARFLEPSENDDLVKNEMSRIPRLQGALPVILMTLQYKLNEYAPDYVPDGIMTESLRKVICNTAQYYHWMIRLHPCQMLGQEKKLIYSYLEKNFGHFENVHWQWCSTMALPAMLSMCKLHITHYSATTIEAAKMGLPTILLDPHIASNGKHHRFYQYEREIGMASVITLNSDAIEKAIRKLLAYKIQNKNQYSGKNNILNFINKFKKDNSNTSKFETMKR